MSIEQADRYAARIVGLFGELARAPALRASEHASATGNARVVELGSGRYANTEDAREALPLLYAADG